MSAKFFPFRSSLPAVTWLTRAIESDPRKSKRPPGSTRLMPGTCEFLVPPPVQRTHKGMASLYRQPLQPHNPRRGENPPWPDTQVPLSFPGPD